MEKRDIHHRKRDFQTTTRNLKNNDIIVPRNRQLILDFIRDCRLGKTVKKKQKKVIGVARCTKYIHILVKISLWIGKPFDEVNDKDMEDFIAGLENDKYRYERKTRKGETISVTKYSHATKLDYKKTIKKFYKWLFGKNEYYPELVNWIETYERIKEIPALKREEVEKLVVVINIRNKAIIMSTTTACQDSGTESPHSDAEGECRQLLQYLR
ncbi:MAG: hypothetical protein ACE5EE_05190 [Fidelibacterota bacterium]